MSCVAAARCRNCSYRSGLVQHWHRCVNNSRNFVENYRTCPRNIDSTFLVNLHTRFSAQYIQYICSCILVPQSWTSVLRRDPKNERWLQVY
jgi:hypothetical protein